MEARKLTIIQTKNQTTKVIMSAATTLGELKADLRNNEINYDGMTFYEGLSKTEIMSDDSILPHDIVRNGVVTNELVFMLTNTDKKIKSGISERQEVYEQIKRFGLKDKVVDELNKNYTQCSTEALKEVIKKFNKSQEDSNKKETVEKTNRGSDCGYCDCSCIKKAVVRLLSILEKENYVMDYEAKEILGIMNGTRNLEDESLDSPYTQDELDKMFRGI